MAVYTVCPLEGILFTKRAHLDTIDVIYLDKHRLGHPPLLRSVSKVFKMIGL